MSKMFKINIEEVKDFESDLKAFPRAFAFATRQTLNDSAFQMSRRVKARIRKVFVLRNKFTARSIRVEKTMTLRVNAQESVVGSTASYMEDQEFGGTKTKGGKVGVSIPTTTASGEGRGTQPRRRVARGPNKLSKIRLKQNRIKAMNQKQENLIKIKEAAKSGNKYVFLDLQRHPGIYKVTGGKRRPKINLIHDMSKKSVRIPRTQIFLPTTIATQKQMPLLYRDALIFQLRRRGLFKE
ncbi:hypothetical protein KAR91_31655 [Candidatus Pacearchaeota archaeon]|nr:hypothetical protein [Candidatus Pacearchaeota archaeon]